ncbi:MAG TPA: BadF/BadG/BcrA/BcrD ATPase family protein [Bacteroidota bacterium]
MTSGTTAYVIGLDGGGTKTVARLADLNGAALAESRGGPSNFQVIGVEESAKTILDLIETCCHSIGCNSSEIGSVVAGLAGAGRPQDRQRIAEGIQDLAQKRGLYLRDLRIESDARIALEGAFEGNRGIVLIAGTGSIVFASDGHGKVIRAGGWGRLIGDEGSGYHIGNEGLRAVARMMDGRGKATLLAGMIRKQLALGDQESIIKAVYKESFEIASVAPVVLQAAGKKDARAIEILDSAASELLVSVQAVLKKLRPGATSSSGKIPLVFIGSLLTSENVYSRKVRSLIRKKLPAVSIQLPAADPVQGAVLMAIASGAHGVTGKKKARLAVA